nr:unnamed protein product [Callosobruchus chinensis]
MKVYCGLEKIDGMPVANKIVMELMGNLLDAGRTLFSDSWYTGVGLAKGLLAKNTSCWNIEKQQKRKSEASCFQKFSKRRNLW